MSLAYHCPECGKNIDYDDVAQCNVTVEMVEFQGVMVPHRQYDPGCPRCGATDLEDYDEDIHYNKEDWQRSMRW